jgi:hypothetical protein
MMAKICSEYKKWVEEKVEKPIDDWVKKTEKQCKKRKWYDPRRWLCWLVTTFVKVVRWVVVWVGKWVTYIFCEVVSFVVNFLAVVVGLILSIPIIGRLVGLLWRGLVDLFWRIVNLPDVIAGIFGLYLPKKLRVCIIILSDEKRNPLATAASLQPDIDKAKRIYKDTCNVNFIVSEIHTLENPAPKGNLDPNCDAGALGDDLWVDGTYFENNANVQCFDSAFVRLIGFASPVIVFIVRNVQGDNKGCSLGPFSDYVTVEGADPICLAHEVSHACGLWHSGGETNLANHICGGTKLKGWQVAIVRSSRHVTFI